MSEQDGKRLVKLTSVGTVEEGSLVKALLDANGIFCTVPGEQHRSTLGNIYGGFIDLPVMVREEDLNRAHELLTRNTEELEKAAEEEALASGAPSDVPEGQHGDVTVPVAGDTYADRRRARVFWYFAVFWMVPIAAILFATVRGCAR